QVGAGAAGLRLRVQRRAGGDVVRDVGDVDAEPVAARRDPLHGQRVVVVPRVLGIDREYQRVAQIQPVAALARPRLVERPRLALGARGESSGQAELGGDPGIVPFGTTVGAQHL